MNSLFTCPELIILLSRYQMLYEMGLKDFSGPSMGVYPRWLCCLLLSFFAYICFAIQVLNRNLLGWEGDIIYMLWIFSCTFYMFLSVIYVLFQVNFCLHHCSCIPFRCPLFRYCWICRDVGVSPCQCQSL